MNAASKPKGAATRRLYLERVVGPGEFGHIARPQHTRNRLLQPHTHDFAEIFWVNSGRGRHLINGRVDPLAPGDFICILPDDVHTLEASGSEPLTITNVAFPAEVVEWLRTRYFSRVTRWFWLQAAAPERARPERMTDATLHALNAEADRLAVAPRSRLHFEHFLLGAFAELSGRHHADADIGDFGGPGNPGVPGALRNTGAAMAVAKRKPVPDWLAAACRQMRSAEMLREGLPALFRAAGRSPEHVARSMRGALGMTPSDFLNQRRIAYAAFQLQMTVRPVTEIAMDAGYENLSHFFHVFRQMHGVSPRQYRGKTC